MNRYAWNLRWESPTPIPGAFYTGTGPRGPLALPGKYTIKLTVGGQTQSQPLEIVIDPRVKNMNPADLDKQFALQMQVRQANDELHRAVNQIRELRGELKTLHQRMESDPKFKPLLQQADALDSKMTPIEEQLIQVNMKGSEANLAFPDMLNELFDAFTSSLEFGDNAPTQQQYEVYKKLRARLDQQLTAWRQIMSSDVPAFNNAMKGADIPTLYVAPASQ
jgi:DNA-binding FrmR family transcriptional regulator